jgi:hypothetical protein
MKLSQTSRRHVALLPVFVEFIDKKQGTEHPHYSLYVLYCLYTSKFDDKIPVTLLVA